MGVLFGRDSEEAGRAMREGVEFGDNRAPSLPLPVNGVAFRRKEGVKRGSLDAD